MRGCTISALIPAIVAGALAGAGVAWTLSWAEWAVSGDRMVLGIGGPGYIALVLVGAAGAAVVARRSGIARSACEVGRSDAG